jgi:proteasome lid subunit RPN8/RPN11
MAEILEIPRAMLQEMFAHAKEAYPQEACGIITGTGRSLTRLTRCRNAQDELNAEDPERYPRTSRDGYNIDSRDMFKILRGAEALGEEIKVIYHSHVDAGAYFSSEDKGAATWDGEPTYPDVAYIVISVVAGTPESANLYHWKADQRDFEGRALGLPRRDWSRGSSLIT